MATDFPDDTSVRVTRDLPAALDRVWAAFTEPADMEAWMWAGWGSDTVARADARVGGRYEVYTTPPDKDESWPSDRWGFYGYYTVLDKPSRLVYTLHWDGPVGYNQRGEDIADEAVVVEMQATDLGTYVVMWHMGIPPVPAAAPAHGQGIEAMFDALEEYLT